MAPLQDQWQEHQSVGAELAATGQPAQTLAALISALIEALREHLRADLLAELQAEQQAFVWPEWMNIETAARYLDMPVERIRKLVARRAIPFCQEGRGCRIFFSRPDLDAWMRSWSNRC